jgi:hypothetical protein
MKLISERASAYLANMPVSVSGQGGHVAAFAAALVLVKGFDLSEEKALPLLAEWNAACRPPWTESELRHKLRSAAASQKPEGYLLGESDAPARERNLPDFENEAETKARQRKAWPDFRTLNAAEIRRVAASRGIPPDAVDLLHRLGIARGACVDGHDCFVLRGENFAQARRLDGEQFMLRDGERAKSKTLCGSNGKGFIGQSLLFPEARNVLLVEGCVGLLEAVAALLQVDTQNAWAAIAAKTSGSRFAHDPALLRALRGRRVVIVADRGEAGREAAASWLQSLKALGTENRVLRLPQPFSDLGDLLKATAISQETKLETLRCILA